jgi:hypothetical protein
LRSAGADEGKLAQLDPDLEGEERQWDLRRGQADFGQGSGKAKAVQQAEAGGDRPRGSLRQRPPALAHAGELDREEIDAERDGGLDRGLRHVDHSQRS